MPINAQAGAKDETTYATPVVVDTFYPVLSDSMVPNKIVTQSKGLTATGLVARQDQRSVVVAGWQGSHAFEIQDKGAQPWLKRTFGALATGSTGTDGQIPYTATLASLCNYGFTLQTNKKTGNCASADQAITTSGTKVNTWSIEMANQGNLTYTAALLAASGTSATALATASYASGAQVYSWGTGVSILVNSVSIPCHSWKIQGDNKLTLDTFTNGTISEPSTQDILDGLIVTLQPDWTTATKALYDAGITPGSGNVLPIVITLTSPRIIGGTTHASLSFTMPACSIDAPPPELTGPGKFAPTVTGTVLDDGTDAPITVVYTA